MESTPLAPQGVKYRPLEEPLRGRASREPTHKQPIQIKNTNVDNLTDNIKYINYIRNLKQIKMKITTTKTTQTANEVLGTKEKTLYYLIIENKKGEKLVINVGEKTNNGIENLLKNDK